jgi:hypothetical protein
MSASVQMDRSDAVISDSSGGLSMFEYKLYCLDAHGRIARRQEFEAADDQAAVAHARAHHPAESCELWCGARKVALLPGKGEPQLSRSA